MRLKPVPHRNSLDLLEERCYLIYALAEPAIIVIKLRLEVAHLEPPSPQLREPRAEDIPKDTPAPGISPTVETSPHSTTGEASL